MVSFALCFTSAAMSADELEYDLDIPQLSLDEALKSLARQVDVQLLFPFDLVKTLNANPVKGRYTLAQALEILLEGTGLVGDLTGSGVITISRVTSVSALEVRMGDTMKTTSKAGLVAIVAGALAGGVGAQETTVDETEVQTSIVTGKVTDARTGANLKGAKVTIEETRQWTSTNDLGEFRFVGVPKGSATLTVSYLGYAGQSAVVGVRGGGTSQDFALRGGSEMEEIVVFGRRSSRALALNQERSAENFSTVLSSDALGQFPGTTISEALRRAPGVAFEQSEVSGDGTNVIVRGLEPDLNQVTLNGLRLPESSGVGRSANLGNILTDSISKITISKTLLPNQDSNAVGGLIDIETRSPLDRPKRFGEMRIERGERSDDFLEENIYSAAASGIFGTNESIGLGMSAQYRTRDIRRLNYDVDLGANRVEYLPLDSNGVPITNPVFIEPTVSFPFESGVDALYPGTVFNGFNGAELTNLSLTLSAHFRISNHTDLKAEYIRTDEEKDAFTRNSAMGGVGVPTILPVDELGGELRAAYVTEDALAAFGFPAGILAVLQHSYFFEAGTSEVSDILSLRGSTKVGEWTFSYKLGRAEGESDTPVSAVLNLIGPEALAPFVQLDPSLLSPAALANTVDSRVVSIYAPRSGAGYPLPLLNQSGFNFLNDSQNYISNGGSLARGTSGENTRDTAEFAVRYSFDQKALKYLEIGVFHESIEFRNLGFVDGFSINPAFPGVPTVADMGLEFGLEPLADIGIDTGLNVISQSDIEHFFANVNSIAASLPNLSINELSAVNLERERARFVRERNLAAYVQARVDIGKLEITGGARLDRLSVESRNLIFPFLIDENGVTDQDFIDRNSSLVNQESTKTELLPRLAMTYRFTDDLILRAGYFKSVSRPRIDQLSDVQRISINLQPIGGVTGVQPTLAVSQGNPDLDPTQTHSYDVSLEYYFDDVGQFKMSVFYKDIENLLESNFVSGSDSLSGVILPDDPRIAANLDNFFVSVTKPVNSPFDATVWGAETAVEKQFTFLPGLWSGFGAYLNYTYTESSKTQSATFLNPTTFEFEEVFVPDVRFSGDPKHSGTVAVTYNAFGIDSAMAFTVQDRRLAQFRNNNLSVFDERDESLDFRAEYRFEKEHLGGHWRIWFEALDILKSTEDGDVESSIGGESVTPKYYIGANYFGGREYRLGVTASFQ